VKRGSFDTESLRLIGERIRSVRGVLTQAAFAGAIDVGRVALANYEAGRRLPNREVLDRIAALGATTVNWLLTGLPSAPGPGQRAGRTTDKERTALFWAERLRKMTGAEFVPKIAISNDELAIIEILRHAEDEDVLSLAERTIGERLAKDWPGWDSGYFSKAYRKQIKRVQRMRQRGYFERADDLGSLVGMTSRVAAIRHKIHGAAAAGVRQPKQRSRRKP
jgi:transcriptional regulator with XRE-family HTH domain